MRFLLDLADPEAEPQIAARLGLPSRFGGPASARGGGGASLLTAMFGADREAARRVFAAPDTPRSILRWLLELDDPDANYLVYQADVPDAVRRDILLGVPYGPGAAEPGFRVPVSSDLHPERDLKDYHYRSFRRRARLPYHEGYDDAADVEQRGIISTLYEAGKARQLKKCKRAAAALSGPEWSVVAAADRAEPMPGYARWALCVQVGCPEELRRQLGGYDPHFTARMSMAGFLLDGSAAYACAARPPGRVLAVLECVARAAPQRAADAAAALRPLVEQELGDNLEAWAVLARLLPGFAGSLPELIVTSGAIAAGSG
ncbi:hypothetical protein KDL01_12625 [Actinospica durhamensis]|uniref:Uncharacterized protein n=1 Tax=Actinospica durhamensis TaxID=1508375 RepID=A0A941IT94_9ACTN|nr:hypothetical protein [Actinospica durhamensis]MBR7834116.1 hypothetical protein [Actinospica durhamensis]